MKVSVRQAGVNVPVKIYHNNVVLTPRLDNVNYGVKPKSVFRYRLDPYETSCSRCGTQHALVNANQSKGYRLYWNCLECGYPLMSMQSDSYEILNTPVRWYKKLWWQIKVGLRRVFNA